MTEGNKSRKAQISKIAALLLLSLSTISSESFANKDRDISLNQTDLYLLSKKEKLNGAVGEGVANRIEFGLLGFREIIGDESKYTFITDQNNKNIFLTPKVPAGQNITLSLINQAGEIVDLNLSVQKTGGQVIKIDKKISRVRACRNSEFEEITSMLKAMQKDIDTNGKYYVVSEPRSILSNIERLKITQDRTYKYGKLIGTRLEVCNLAKSLKELHLSDFKNIFENPLAISIQKKVLKSKETGFIYVLTKEKTND